MFTVTKTTQGAYTAYVLADTGAGTTATVVPEKGGMVTSFTKNGDEYSWLREPNFSQPERPRCAMPVLFPMCGRAPQDANTFGGKSYPMIIHGIVHLCGITDKGPGEREIMEETENKALAMR